MSSKLQLKIPWSLFLALVAAWVWHSRTKP